MCSEPCGDDDVTGPNPHCLPMRIRVSQIMDAWRRGEEPHSQSQSSRQSHSPPGTPPRTCQTCSRRLRDTRYSWSSSPNPTALSALLSIMAQPRGTPPRRARYRVGLLTCMFTQYVFRGTARGFWRAGDRPISCGPVDSCPRENPPTAVSVFPLAIYETDGSCRFANLSPGVGRGRTGRWNGALIRYIALGDVTDCQRISGLRGQMGTTSAGEIDPPLAGCCS